ncbi:MAG: murein L,D-transpeptidase family protein [Cytophagaceae bacterium]
MLDWRNSKSSCYKSIHISYPNADDIKRAKKQKVDPGGSIMIHGLHPAMEVWGKEHARFNWTWGCVAVSNVEMDEIWVSVKNGTPIEIKP